MGSLLTKRSDLILAGALLVLFLIPLLIPAPVVYLQGFIGEHYLQSALAFVLLMFLSTVVAPIAVPLAVPAAAPYLGALPTALLAILGWSAGALVAFLIARRYGRPLVTRMVDSQKLERFERWVPQRHLFWWILTARMLLPVDVLSYALGIVSKVPLGTYMLATVLAISPFAFIFAYAGDALILREYGRVVGFIGLGALLLLGGWLLQRALTR